MDSWSGFQIRVGRFLYLLISLFVFLSISTSWADASYNFILSTIFFSLTIVLALFVVTHNKLLLAINIILALVTMVLRWSYVVVPDNLLDMLGSLASCLFCFFNATMILIEVARTSRVTMDVIYATLSVYLLIGLAWGFLYTFVEIWFPNAFAITSLDPHSSAGPRPYLIYFSFVTLSTLGYGDIYPVLMVAKSLASIEAIVGQLFLVVMISRLVSIHVSQGVNKIEKTGSEE